MKLLFLHDAALDSGRANAIQVLHMCHAFAQWGQDVTLAVPASRAMRRHELLKEAAAQIGKAVEFKIVPYRKCTVAGRFTMIGGCLGASCLLKRVQPDCCLTRNPIYLNLILQRGLRTVFESHNSILHDNHFLNRAFSRNLLRNGRRNGLVGFIAISQNLADFWIKAGIPRQKTLVLHDGVDVESYQPAPDVQLLRRQLRLPLDRKIVTYTGSFYPDREIEKILLLAQANPQTFFVLVGGPNENSARFADLASQLRITNITFPGRVSHARVKDYLFAADVLLMVWSRKVRTINYCSPLKVFEYMAAGRTIVGHRFPTICEVLSDGKNALLADPDSFDDLKGKLTQAISMPTNNSLAQAARKLAFDKYSWNSRASQILSFIRYESVFDDVTSIQKVQKLK